MGDTDLSTRSLGSDLLRSIFSAFDRPAYWLLGLVYELFFNVASANILSGNMMAHFYGRVQIILGVFMMFELAVVFLRAIAEPDSFSKDKGFGSLLTRVVTSLLILTSLIPINMPSPRNSYEARIKENGLLFGTLYSLQDRILQNNSIGKLIMGTSSSDTDYYAGSSNSTANQKLKQAANNFTTTVLRGFYRVNLIPEESRTSNGNGDPDRIRSNRVCSDNTSDKVIQSYYSDKVSPGDIISMVNETCDVNDDFLSTLSNGVANVVNFLLPINLLSGNKKYVFTYMPIISTIVGVVFVFIFISFTIDVAVRAIKLGILRLLAPIPVLAHIDPRGSKDSAFNAWVKTLTSTYLDLFIRLAVVYFVIFIIQSMIANGISMNTGTTGAVNVFTKIAIWIGLFVFAKQAPKFIKDMIGIKGDSFKLFGGLGDAMGVGAVAAGTIGSFNASRESSRQADIANGRDPNSFWNRGKHIISGIGGGVSGGITGARAYAGAKDHQGKTVMDAISKRNAESMQRGLEGSTLFGRVGAGAARAFRGDGSTNYDSRTRDIAQKKSIDKAANDLFSYLEGKGKTDGASTVVSTSGIDALGGAKIRMSFDDFNRRKAQALAAEQSGRAQNANFTITNDQGQTITINAHDAVAEKVGQELAYAAGDAWAVQSGAGDAGFTQKQATYNESIKGARDARGHGLYQEYQIGGSHTASRLKKTSKAAAGEAARGEADPSYKRQKANYGSSSAQKK